jgi:GntR family transcriptional regulator
MSKVKRDLRKVLGFTANMQEMGLSPSTRVLSKKIVSANAFARQRLGLEKGAMVVKINRLRLANDVPMMLETRYIKTDLCPGIEKLDLSSSLWKVFENVYNHKPYRHTQNVTIARFSGPQAALFGLEGGALAFLINGVTYIKDGQPIECEESLYRSDKYDLAFEAFLEE